MIDLYFHYNHVSYLFINPLFHVIHRIPKLWQTHKVRKPGLSLERLGTDEPIVVFPALRRCSLMRLMMDAKIGVLGLLAEVPTDSTNCGSLKVAILSPLAATSGYLVDVNCGLKDQ